MADEEKKTQDVETSETSNNEEKEEGKVLTQKEIDEIVKTRLDRERAKLSKEADEKIKKSLEEAEKLAMLSAEERQKELEAKTRKELAEKEANVSKRENRLDAIEKFREHNVPIDLVEYVVVDDKEETLKKTDAFIDNYKNSVSASVANELKGTPPKDIADNSKSDTTAKEVVTSF